jgi:hypothetical protein
MTDEQKRIQELETELEEIKEAYEELRKYVFGEEFYRNAVPSMFKLRKLIVEMMYAALVCKYDGQSSDHPGSYKKLMIGVGKIKDYSMWGTKLQNNHFVEVVDEISPECYNYAVKRYEEQYIHDPSLTVTAEALPKSCPWVFTDFIDKHALIDRLPDIGVNQNG